MKTKQSPTLPEPPSVEEMESQALATEGEVSEEDAVAQLFPELLKPLKRIAYYTSKVGLSLEESCMLVDLNFEAFSKLLQEQPILKKIIDMKELEYKKDLLYTLSQKARTGDDKLAQWLLERRYPSEFSNKRSNNPNADQDLLYQAISFVQKSGDSSGLIQESSGKAIVVRKAPNGEPQVNLAQKLKDILK